MDRRHFFKTALFTPLLGPFLSRSRPADSAPLLYLISDSPHLYLPPLLRELRTAGLITGPRFSFFPSSLFDEELLLFLIRTGWKPAPPSSRSDFSLSFDRLDRHVDPSFALVKDGKIRDIRFRNLESLWRRMNRKQGPSSLLTVVAFNNSSSRIAGRFVSVYQDGHKIDTLDLNKNVLKSFLTANGHIIVKIKDNKAKVVESCCQQKICCFSPSLSLAGERTICAPNHFLLEVERTVSVDTSIG